MPNGTPAKTVAATGTGVSQVVRKRSSSLMRNSSSLPTVEHSLEEFIAKANQTLVDVSGWGNAGEEAKADEGKRREQDAQRWQQAETQMRESEAREQSLRRQLDGLQGKLAEAEARAAVAGTQVGSAAHDSTIHDLKTQIDMAMQRMRSAEEKSQELAQALASAKSEVHARPATPVSGGMFDDDAEERVRIAEAKAAKAIAAARAAQAGLTVSSADLAAIESGLVVVAPPARKSPWLAVAVAFIGGLGIMFAVWKFVLNKDSAPTPAAGVQPTQVETAAPAAPAAPTTPVVTPIDDKAAPAAPAVNPQPQAAVPTVTPIEEPKAAVEPPKAAVEEPKAAVEEPKAAVEEPKAPAVKKPVRVKKPAKPALADPFAAPKKPAKADKKPAGGIVDPF